MKKISLLLVLVLLLTVLPVNPITASAATGDSPSYLLEDFEGSTFNDIGEKKMYATAKYGAKGPGSDGCIFVSASLRDEKVSAKKYGPVFDFALRNGTKRGNKTAYYTYDISVWIKVIYDLPADNSVTFVFTKNGTEYKTKVENAGLKLHEWVKVNATYTHNVTETESSPVKGDFYFIIGDGKTTEGLTVGRQYAIDDVTVIPRAYYLDQSIGYSPFGVTYTFRGVTNSNYGTSEATAKDGFWVENATATLSTAPLFTSITDANTKFEGKCMTITDDGSGNAKLYNSGIDYRNGVEYRVSFLMKGNNDAALNGKPTVTIDRTDRTDRENIKDDFKSRVPADICYPYATNSTKTLTSDWREYIFIVRAYEPTYDTADSKFFINLTGGDTAGAQFTIACIRFYEDFSAGRAERETLIAGGGIKGYSVGNNLYNIELDNYVTSGNVTECITQLLVPCNGEYALLKKFNNWENHETLQLSLTPEQAEGLIIKVTPKDKHEFYGETYITTIDMVGDCECTATAEFDQTVWAPDMPEITATVHYNAPTGDESLRALCATYDSSDRMLTYDIKVINLIQGEGEAKLSMNVSPTGPAKDAMYAKVFLWDNTTYEPKTTDVTKFTKTQDGTFIYVHPDGVVNTTYGYNNPVPTVKDAVDAFAGILNENPNADIKVILHPGYHFVSEPIKINETMTSETGKVTFMSYDKNDKGIISGGRLVTERWSAANSDRTIWKTTIRDLKNLNLRHVYVNDTRATRARYDGPFAGAVNTSTYNELDYVSPGGNGNGSLGVLKMDTDEKILNLTRPQDLECVFYNFWIHSRCGVDSITDDGNGTMTFNMTSPGWELVNNMGYGHATTPAWIENALEFVDESGEFYFNKSSGVLYYMPREDELDMSGSRPAWRDDNEVIIPVLDNYKGATGGGAMIEILGTAEDTVENITFDGIEFSHTTWSRPSTVLGHAANQNNHKLDNPVYNAYTDGNFGSPFEYGILRSAAIDTMYADNVDFTNCVFSHMGSTALRQLDGTDNSDVTGCEFYDISGNAITMGEPYQGVKITGQDDTNLAEERMLDNNTVTNNYIHHVAVEYESAAALSIGHPRNVLIANNEICHIPYSGMHLGYGWQAVEKSNMSGIVIEKNYIHDLFYSGVHDGGAIYSVGASGGTAEDPNIIRDNHIERVGPGAAGIYNDQGSSKWSVYNNVVDFRDTSAQYNGTFAHYPKWCNVNTTAYANVDTYLTWTNNFATLKKIYTPYYATHPDGHNTFEAVYLDDETGMWPAQAYSIIAQAGITDEYRNNFKFGLQDVIVAEKVTLSVGESFANTPCITGIKDARYKSNDLVISVSSSNEAVATATVDAINAVGKGTAIITYTAEEKGLIVKTTTKVTVK